MDYAKINEAAQNYLEDMTRFLRAIVKNPGESCDEKAHIDTIAAEMKRLEFDEVVIDPQGNVIGYMGTGDRSLHTMRILTQLVLEISKTGNSILMKVMKQKKKSAAAVSPTSAADSYLLFTEQKS